MATKLHELLAVKDNLVGQATKLLKDLKGTFKGKRHLFEEKHKVFQPLGENTANVVEEQSDIQTSIVQELHWIRPHLAKAVNAQYQMDLANMEAKADLVLDDGTVLLTDVPAMTLLHLEKHKIPEWKELIEAIPTLDPAKGFQPDRTHRIPFVFKARDVTKDREKPDRQVITLAPATDKHPAQTALVDVRTKTGTILEQEWSALLTPAKKSELLEAIEELYRAVARARSKANEHSIDLTGKKIGEKLLEVVFEPLERA